MNIKILENIPIDWDKIPSEKINGTSGFVISKMVEFNYIRIRLLHFSENYEADHWCDKGHIIFVVFGELVIEYKDNTHQKILTNNSVILGDNILSHKVITEIETKVFIID